MSISLITEWSVRGIDCSLPDGTKVARIVAHGYGFYEIWAEPRFSREGFPFLWTGREAAEYAVLALASDGLQDPQSECKPKTAPEELLDAARGVEKILAPFIDAKISAPSMIEAVTAMRNAIKRMEEG